MGPWNDKIISMEGNILKIMYEYPVYLISFEIHFCDVYEKILMLLLFDIPVYAASPYVFISTYHPKASKTHRRIICIYN